MFRKHKNITLYATPCTCKEGYCQEACDPYNCIRRMARTSTIVTKYCKICDASTWHKNGKCLRHFSSTNSDGRMLSFFLGNLWRWKCTLSEHILPSINHAPDYDSLVKTKWSPEFESLMRARLIQGGMRYGFLNAPGKPDYDRITSIIERAKQYQNEGTLELLVDIANLCLLEFEEGRHSLRHFEYAETIKVPVVEK